MSLTALDPVRVRPGEPAVPQRAGVFGASLLLHAAVLVAALSLHGRSSERQAAEASIEMVLEAPPAVLREEAVRPAAPAAAAAPELEAPARPEVQMAPPVDAPAPVSPRRPEPVTRPPAPVAVAPSSDAAVPEQPVPPATLPTPLPLAVPVDRQMALASPIDPAPLAIPEPVPLVPAPGRPVPAKSRPMVPRPARPVARPVSNEDASEPRATPAPPPAAPLPTTPVAPPPAAPPPSSAAISRQWQGALAAWIQSRRRYPEEARRNGEQGSVVVSFTVARDGQVLDASLKRRSGSDALDQAVMAMFRSARLPAFPPEMQVSEVTVTLPVRYRLED